MNEQHTKMKALVYFCAASSPFQLSLEILESGPLNMDGVGMS